MDRPRQLRPLLRLGDPNDARARGRGLRVCARQRRLRDAADGVVGVREIIALASAGEEVSRTGLNGYRSHKPPRPRVVAPGRGANA
jgi:hypothetical protein